MATNAVRVFRKMRGGAQAHLMEADDSRFYVVKFRNNPQHRRILVNELIASVFLEHLGITAAKYQLVRITPEFLRDNPEAYIQLGSRRIGIEPGWHFGSAYPGHPDRLAVYDFLPDALLHKVENMRDFMGVLAFDKWTCNADARQSVFFRARLKDWTAPEERPGARVGFVALMIDHGYIFNGPQWEFADSPIQGLYFRPLVYESVCSLADFEPWAGRIENFPEEVFDDAYRRIPPEWLEDDTDTLEALLEKLYRRRKRVPDLLMDVRRGRSGVFPAWK